jgi:hypothetical protein
MLRSTGLNGVTAVTPCFNGRGIRMFVGGCRFGAGSLPRPQDWIMPYLPEIAKVYHRYCGPYAALSFPARTPP